MVTLFKVVAHPELNHLSEEEVLFLPLIEQWDPEEVSSMNVERAVSKTQLKVKYAKERLASKLYGPRPR